LPPPSILIYRDPRESIRKCSLAGIQGLPGVRFSNHSRSRRFAAGDCILLHHEGAELTSADRGRPLLLVDSSWRHLPELLAAIDGDLTPRRLPPLVTAYPRRSKVFADPAAGLASIEALYAATVILGAPRPDLLAGYHFAEQFLAANPGLRA
jgi:pre-rRNA-processing protein TSR3